MKKYLMSGIAAIAVCAAFTSCSKENLYDENAIVEKNEMAVREAYAQAFEKAFGKVGADVDWGFGPSRANTRAVSDYPAGSNKNRNQWAGIDGPFQLVVPTPLSEGQKLRVKTYFQEHRFLTYEVPDMENYFVQQVYGGDPSTAGSLSTEQYTSAVANADPVIGAAHMDKLTIAGQHVFDFNGADNPNIAEDVLNNGATLNSNQFHSDQITLMLGTRPTYVGYETSEASILKDDCCALVSAKDIDDWINANPNYGENYGKPVWYGKDEAGYDNQYWERSFVGLDYEEKGIESCYTTPWGKEEFAKIWDFCSDLNNTHYVLFHGQYVAASTITNDYLLNPSGDKIHWLSDATNQFLGENLGTTQNTFNKQATINGVNDVKYYDLDAVYSYINQGALPKANNMEFIKNVGGRDYVFSDWIVTLAPAKTYDNPPTPNPVTEIEKLRVIAEDLSVDEYSDFDFNDVVFDVIWTKTFSDETKANLTSQKVEIELLAAGGTLPLYVDGKEVHEQFNTKDPEHSITVTTMVNTRASARGLKGKDGIASVIWETTKDPNANTIGTIANSIEVKVEKNGEILPIQAIRGKVTSKIGVGIDYDWCNERQDIEAKYNLLDGTSPFQDWVKGIYPAYDWYIYAPDKIVEYRSALGN